MSGQRILLIENDEASLDIYGTALRHFGFEVWEAATAEVGLRMLRSDRPDLVILDLGLPGMDGFEVIAEIRGDARTAGLPIVVCTVHSFPWDEERARSAGSNVFLEKPVAPQRLLEEIRGLLDPRAAPERPDRP